MRNGRMTQQTGCCSATNPPPWGMAQNCPKEIAMENNDYSPMFYVMLIIGIIGVLGFVMVAAGGGA